MWESHLDAELAKEDSLLGCGTEADNFGLGGIKDLERGFSGASGDGATVDQEDVADRREAGIRDVREGSVGVADDGAGIGACESAPSEG